MAFSLSNIINKISDAIKTNSSTFYGGNSTYPEMSAARAAARDAAKPKSDGLLANNGQSLSEGNTYDVGSDIVNSSNNNGLTLTDSMQFQSDLQDKLLSWQEKMAGQSHQLEVKDLQAAGLNPILSANNGATSYSASAASSPASLDIAKLNAKTTLEAAKINSTSAANVANIYSNATKYAANLGLTGKVIDSLIPF